MTDHGFPECTNCNHVGPDVHYWPTYVGGKGRVPIAQCDHIPLCWQRKEHNDRHASWLYRKPLPAGSATTWRP